MFSPLSLFAFYSLSCIIIYVCFFYSQRVPLDLEVECEKTILFQRSPIIYNFISQANIFLFVLYCNYNVKPGPDNSCFVTPKNCVCDTINLEIKITCA